MRNNFGYLRNYWTDRDGENTNFNVIVSGGFKRRFCGVFLRLGISVFFGEFYAAFFSRRDFAAFLCGEVLRRFVAGFMRRFAVGVLRWAFADF